MPGGVSIEGPGCLILAFNDLNVLAADAGGSRAGASAAIFGFLVGRQFETPR
jgi:hypothetical protein